MWIPKKNIRRREVYAHISGRATAAVCICLRSEVVRQVADRSEEQLTGRKA